MVIPASRGDKPFTACETISDQTTWGEGSRLTWKYSAR